MKPIWKFLLGALTGTFLGIGMSMFGWMFHYDAVPHFLFPIIFVIYLPLWIGGYITGPLIYGIINYLIEYHQTPTQYGDWPYEWNTLYNWLVFTHTLLWMAIGYGLLFLLVSKVIQHIKTGKSMKTIKTP